MVGSLALHGFLNVLSPFQLLGALTDAVKDIDYGLDNLEGEDARMRSISSSSRAAIPTSSSSILR